MSLTLDARTHRLDFMTASTSSSKQPHLHLSILQLSPAETVAEEISKLTPRVGALQSGRHMARERF